MKAICHNCKSIQNVTLKRRDVPLSDDSKIIKNVLVGVCDNCDSVCVLPQESVSKVRGQMNDYRN